MYSDKSKFIFDELSDIWQGIITHQELEKASRKVGLKIGKLETRSHGRSVIIKATLVDGNGINIMGAKTFAATCSKEDKYDYVTGFIIAYKRMIRYCKSVGVEVSGYEMVNKRDKHITRNS